MTIQSHLLEGAYQVHERLTVVDHFLDIFGNRRETAGVHSNCAGLWRAYMTGKREEVVPYQYTDTGLLADGYEQVDSDKAEFFVAFAREKRGGNLISFHFVVPDREHPGQFIHRRDVGYPASCGTFEEVMEEYLAKKDRFMVVGYRRKK